MDRLQAYEQWKDNFLQSVEEDKELRKIFNDTQSIMRDIAAALLDKAQDIDLSNTITIGSRTVDSELSFKCQ